jgi:hypothetical protein
LTREGKEDSSHGLCFCCWPNTRLGDGKKTLGMDYAFVVGHTHVTGDGQKTLNIASAFVVGKTIDKGRERRL